MNKVITVTEFEKIPLSQVRESIGDAGISIIKRQNIRQGEIFRLGYDTFQATQYVGFTRIRDCTIQVVPKIFRDTTENLHFLLQLLSYTKRIKVREQDLGHLNKLKHNFFEVIIYLFAKNLLELLRRDFRKEYVTYEEDSPFLKGKLLLSHQVKRNIFDQTKYHCRFDELTENHIMNQIFKYTAGLLMRVSISSSNKKLLEDILLYLCDVDNVVVKLHDIQKVHFTRLNNQYEPLVNLCRLILANMSVEFRASHLETFVFMFDMNKLFEEFVFEFVRKHHSVLLMDGEEIISVRNQTYLGMLFDEFQMRGDIIIETAMRKVLLDTKYKVLDEGRHQGLSQADFYQMFSYSYSQQEKYREIILLYPATEIRPVREKLMHVIDGGQIRIYLKTIQLTRIYDTTKRRIDEQSMIEEMQRIFQLQSCVLE